MPVILYTTKTCPRCAIVKKWLEDIGTPFTTKSLEDSEVMADLHMRNAPVLAAPALEIDGIVFEYRGGE